eukprot:2781284-Rhodomonas_salina.1
MDKISGDCCVRWREWRGVVRSEWVGGGCAWRAFPSHPTLSLSLPLTPTSLSPSLSLPLPPSRS